MCQLNKPYNLSIILPILLLFLIYDIDCFQQLILKNIKQNNISSLQTEFEYQKFNCNISTKILLQMSENL